MRIATVEVGLWVCRTTLEGAIEGPDGFLIAFLTQQNSAPGIVRLCPIWGVVHDLVEALQGGFRVILTCQEAPQIIQGEGVVRVQGEGLTTLLYRLVQSSLLPVDNSHTDMHGSRRVFSLEQRTSHLLGVVPAPGHEETVEQCQAGRGIYRISLHSLMQACQFCVVHVLPFSSHMYAFAVRFQL
jgi:hypothetical protein